MMSEVIEITLTLQGLKLWSMSNCRFSNIQLLLTFRKPNKQFHKFRKRQRLNPILVDLLN